jgi:hypothetical protein
MSSAISMIDDSRVLGFVVNFIAEEGAGDLTYLRMLGIVVELPPVSTIFRVLTKFLISAFGVQVHGPLMSLLRLGGSPGPRIRTAEVRDVLLDVDSGGEVIQLIAHKPGPRAAR